jgi:hypothetical protein
LRHVSAKNILIILSLIAASTFIGCETPMKVRHDFPRGTDFPGYQTYIWVPQPPYRSSDFRAVGPTIANAIVSAVERELAAKGYQKGTAFTANFVVGYVAARNRKLESNDINDYFILPTTFYSSPSEAPQPEMITHEHDEGTLVIDVGDVRTGKLMFRGGAQARLSGNPSPEKSSQRINEAVTAILAPFPPAAR